MSTTVTKSDPFKQFIPIELIKGVDKSGRAVVKFKGIASTGSEDADGEWLDPRGFETDYFLKSGIINWNHQSKKSPKASFIGKPTGARITDDGDWEVSGELYSKLPMAQEVIDLQKGLAEYGMCLGMSIEGEALLRDPNNKKKVLKAMISGLAITPTPKNSETTMKLIKGMNLGTLGCERDCDICSCGLEKAFNTDLGGNKPDDEDDLKKEMSAGSDSGQALTRESLDEDMKDISGADKIDDDPKKITKGKALEKLSLSLPNRKALEVLNIYKKLEKIDKMADINLDTIEKALDLLKIGEDNAGDGGEQNNTIEKSVVGEDLIAERDAAQANLDRLNKACVDHELSKGEDEPEAGSGEETEEEKEKKKEEKAGEKTVEPPLAKGGSNELLKGLISDVIGESNNALVKGLTESLVTSVTEKVVDQLSGSFQAVGRLQKGVMDELGKQNDLLTKISEAPNTPKSIMGLGAIKKGFDGGEGDGLTKIDKRAAIDMIDAKLEKAGYADQVLTQSMRVLEAADTLQPAFAAALAKEGYTLT